MPETSTLLLFSAAALLLLVIPGPAVLYIVARSASQGVRAGLVSTAGIHVGTLVHIAAAVLGLSAILVASSQAFTLVKLAGASYLVYLGVSAIWASRTQLSTQIDQVAERPLRKLFRDGVVLNTLNPKTAVFFLAFVPQFVDVEHGSATAQLLVLSAVFVGLGLITDGTFALLAGRLGERLRGSESFERRKNVVAGTSYLALGAVTALGARN